jgi:hypothetical protein
VKVVANLRNLCQQTSLYLTLYNHLLLLAGALLLIKDNNATVIASNCSSKLQWLECTNDIAIIATHAIAATGATSIFIMIGTPVKTFVRQRICSPLSYLTEARSL